MEHHYSYEYPRRFIYLETMVFSIICTLVLFAWIPAVISLFTYGTILGSAKRAAIFLTITAVALLLLLLHIKNELASVRFTLTDSCFFHKTVGSVRKLHLTDIRSIDLIKFPLGGGIMILFSSSMTMWVPLFLCNITDLIERLTTNLANNVNIDLRDYTTLDKIKMIGRASELVTNRSSAAITLLLSCNTVILPFNIFVGAFFWNMSVIPLAVWTIAGPFFPIAGYAVSDFFLRGHEKNYLLSHGDTKELLLAKDIIFSRVATVFIGLYLLAGIFYRSFLLWQQ